MPAIGPLSEKPEAPQQYKQPSRKGKKAWRKHVDVSEVEKGLEKRNEEIIQGGVYKERPSESLFTVDVVGDSAIPKKHPKHIKKTLRADEIIAARSAVPAVSSRKRAADSKTTDGVLPVKRIRKDFVAQKELHRLRKVADGHHESTITLADASYDVWAETEPEEGPVVLKTGDKLEFVSKPVKAKAPETLRHQPISLAANGKPVPAVPTPEGSYSYNPLFTDYVERYNAEGAKAVEAEKQRLAEEAAEQLRAEAVARSAAEAEAAEARADLSKWEEDSAWEGFTSGGEDLPAKSKRPERKTQAQRNRIKRRKEEEQRRKEKASQKLKNIQSAKIKELAAEIEEREAAALAKVEMSDDSDVGDDNELRRRQLGKFRLPEKDLELVLPDELQDSLRLLKPEGNLLKDRYRSLIVRGKMEARMKRPFRKQGKSTVTEKWSYKDFKI
ncbi:hypothetical protein MGG_04142 [Pyricularia oryzae 70-15]|uniref:Ribosome biogenesis protein NOP53 n=3 Tax=Pyricularia oryzae TaxID=318829 RepID=G4NIR7_PYRO7|nr:uncharacterized protein MGG_04142 [Pyricularia oryzae 70-15]EHA47321.1 hypothetical protein MGG_04142 [Pyricularia oryzae 70-15]ELQ41723.1 p60 domain-containing protein [Pyricularia oryzae Y34]KAI7918367.1 hypothetical protein M9X92_006921 [Pyricularia oryzae]KAI7932533.1 hypothetical protein M0657_000282 [Pyricularia oryzae]